MNDKIKYLVLKIEGKSKADLLVAFEQAAKDLIDGKENNYVLNKEKTITYSFVVYESETVEAVSAKNLVERSRR